jgi:Ca-activated chloride channel family protein
VGPAATPGEVATVAELEKVEVDLVASAAIGSAAQAEPKAVSADESIRRRLANPSPASIVSALTAATPFFSTSGAAGTEQPPPPPSPVRFDRRERDQFNTEEYNHIVDNAFIAVRQDPLATLSIDVDTASYANVRRFLNQKTLPPADAVRIEEMVNYFTYAYAAPEGGLPVRINAEVSTAAWNPQHRLVRLGVKGKEILADERAPTNLVFLVDVSGSMRDQNKLPLLKRGMKLLVEQLGENDRVAIVVYAGASGMVLPSTGGDKNGRILAALERLSAGGSTNGGAGIELAYDTAVANFIEGGINRVILATDGDFNVGVTNNGSLTRLIEKKARTGVFLSVLGFGMGNYNDAGLEALADKGNGNYAYIDTIKEARKVLVHEMGSTLVTIAKDVKIQVEFNPSEVNAYRLIGYENRLLEHQDFNDDTKDAGEIGSGHTVTALFEVVPTGVGMALPGSDPLKYQTPPVRPDTRTESGELLTMKVRYKEPDGDESKLMEVPVVDRRSPLTDAGNDYRFAAAVAGFGMLLRDSPHKGDATYDSILELAESSIGTDKEGYRTEFVDLVRRARAIADLNRNE